MLQRSGEIVVVVVDRWKYTPESRSVIAEVSVPTTVIKQWILDAANYVQQHPEVIGKIAAIFFK